MTTIITLAHDVFTSIAINDALITLAHVTKIHPLVRPFNGVSRTNAAAGTSEITPALRVANVRPSLSCASRFPWKLAAGRGRGALKWKGNDLWPEMISSGRVSAGQWSLLANTVTLRRGMIAGGRAGGMIYFWSALNAPPAHHRC